MRRILIVLLCCLLPGLFWATASTDSARSPVAKSENVLTFGPTVFCDSLWQVAHRAMPDQSVTVNQTMISILKQNPNAFYQGNINGLLQGYFLRIPGSKDIDKIPVKMANKTVREQNADWPKMLRAIPKASPYAYLKVKAKSCSAYQTKQVASRMHQFPAAFLLKMDSSQPNSHGTSAGNVFSNLYALSEQNRSLVKNNLLQRQEINQLQKELLALKTRLGEPTPAPIDSETLRVTSPLAVEVTDNTARFPQVKAVVPPSKPSVLNGYLSAYPGLEKFIYMINRIQFYILLAVLILVLLLWYLIYHLCMCRRRQKQETIVQEKSEGQQGYTYLAGEDIVAAKLDLVRAYTRMGDYSNAKEILESIIREGNDAQKAEAKKLMEQIHKK